MSKSMVVDTLYQENFVSLFQFDGFQHSNDVVYSSAPIILATLVACLMARSALQEHVSMAFKSPSRANPHDLW